MERVGVTGVSDDATRMDQIFHQGQAEPGKLRETSSCRVSIACTVSGLRIETPSTSRSGRNASMNRVMSVAVVLSAPAGAACTIRSRAVFWKR